MRLGDLVLALACVFGVNLLPTFGPPTWGVLVFFKLDRELAAVPLVIGGALAAAAGRFTLASVTARCRGGLSERRLDNLSAAREVLTGDRRKALGGLTLFALSPVPSAQLFVAAGLMAVPLVPLTLAFFAGRLVSYSIYVGGAALAQDSLGDAFADALTSPVGIGLQIVMLAALGGLLKVDWAAIAARRSRAR
jgi:uncharacterized membrane protein YdjX (TVP38/TMEM64 family)